MRVSIEELFSDEFNQLTETNPSIALSVSVEGANVAVTPPKKAAFCSFAMLDSKQNTKEPAISAAASVLTSLAVFRQTDIPDERVVLAPIEQMIETILLDEFSDYKIGVLFISTLALSVSVLEILRNLPKEIRAAAVLVQTEIVNFEKLTTILIGSLPASWVVEGRPYGNNHTILRITRKASRNLKESNSVITTKFETSTAENVFRDYRITSAVLEEDEVNGVVETFSSHSGPQPCIFAFNNNLPVALGPVVLDEDDRLRFNLQLPRNVIFDTATAAVDLRLGGFSVDNEKTEVALPERRQLSAERLLTFDRPGAVSPSGRKPIGIILYSFTRTEGAKLVLESLRRQGCLDLVEIWMDGDQGNPKLKEKLKLAEDTFRQFGVGKINRHRGNLGFRKLIIQSLMHMIDTYERFIVLEDDCFPNRFAVEEFVNALEKHAYNPDVLTVYGHHFGLELESPLCPRFQGWGWASYSDKLKPFVLELAYLFSLPESEFVAWAKNVMTPEIIEKIDCTAPRSASKTLNNFFAWDEALALISALAGAVHAPTDKRCIFNFGVGEDSTHFHNIDQYRMAPFNMIHKSEVWKHF